MYKNDENKHHGRGYAISVVFGTAIGLLLILVFFAIMSAIIASGKISEELMRPVAVAAAFIGAIIGAVGAVKWHRAKIMTVGLGVGGLMFLITLIGAFISGKGLSGGMTLPLLIALLAGGIGGGLLNLKRKKHKHSS